MAPMRSLLFRCFSLFLPHLRTLAQEKRSEIVFVLGLVDVVSVSIHYCREISAVSSFKEAAHGAFGIVGARFCSLPLGFWLGLAAVS